MTRGNQRDRDRQRAQARAAKHKKVSPEESKARAKLKMSSADIMRQKQEASLAKKAEEEKKKAAIEEQKRYVKWIRRQLNEFYRTNVPDKVSNLPKIMEKFAVKGWDKLQKGLEKNYPGKAPNLAFEAFKKQD